MSNKIISYSLLHYSVTQSHILDGPFLGAKIPAKNNLLPRNSLAHVTKNYCNYCICFFCTAKVPYTYGQICEIVFIWMHFLYSHYYSCIMVLGGDGCVSSSDLWQYGFDIIQIHVMSFCWPCSQPALMIFSHQWVLQLEPTVRWITFLMKHLLLFLLLLSLSKHALEGYSSYYVCLSDCDFEDWQVAIDWFRYELTQDNDLRPFIMLLFKIRGDFWEYVWGFTLRRYYLLRVLFPNIT